MFVTLILTFALELTVIDELPFVVSDLMQRIYKSSSENLNISSLYYERLSLSVKLNFDSA